MKLFLKQRLFSWLGSYDIKNEESETVYTVKGKLSWGHLFRVYDKDGKEIGYIESRLFSFSPCFRVYMNDDYVGCIRKEITFFKPVFIIDYLGWTIEGDMFEWDYEIYDEEKNKIATVCKEFWSFTDTYVINVEDPKNALGALLLALAIDAEKGSRGE